MSEQAIFEARNGGFVASEYARGPWDERAQHGGAAAALLMRAFEQLPAPDELILARVTYEFLRPVPIGALEVEAQVARPGRRVQLLEASIRDAGGVEVVRARALQVQAAAAGAPTSTPEPPPPGPEAGRENDFQPRFRPMFAPDSIELRFVKGTFHDGGAATCWFRLHRPLVAGEAPSPLQRLAAAGDFGNGIASILSWDEFVFINPDLTLYLERRPAGEWIGLDSRMLIAPEGIGTAESVLYDQRGRVGRATQALVIGARPAT